METWAEKRRPTVAHPTWPSSAAAWEPGPAAIPAASAQSAFHRPGPGKVAQSTPRASGTQGRPLSLRMRPPLPVCASLPPRCFSSQLGSSGLILKRRRCRFNPWVGKIPGRKTWQPTPVCLPRESPWTEEPGELQSMGLQRVGRN